MPTETELKLSRRRNGAWLWAGVLIAPVAFLLDLQVNYMLVPLVCLTEQYYLLHLVALGSLLLSAAGVAIAWRNWKATGASWPGEMYGSIPRSRFMSAIGVLLGSLFVLIILAMWIPNFFLDPCVR